MAEGHKTGHGHEKPLGEQTVNDARKHYLLHIESLKEHGIRSFTRRGLSVPEAQVAVQSAIAAKRSQLEDLEDFPGDMKMTEAKRILKEQEGE